MTLGEQSVLIGCAMAGVALTRFLPFLCFSPEKPTPRFVVYLSKCLAPAVFGLLMVYCFRGPLSGGPNGLPMAIATAVTAVTQALSRRMMISLLVGTCTYVAFVHLVQ